MNKYRYPKREYLDWLDQQHCPSVAAIGLAVLNEVERRMKQTSVKEIGYLTQPIDKLKDEWFEKLKGENAK